MLFEFGLLAALAGWLFAALIFAVIFDMDISACATDGSTFDMLGSLSEVELFIFIGILVDAEVAYVRIKKYYDQPEKG